MESTTVFLIVITIKISCHISSVKERLYDSIGSKTCSTVISKQKLKNLPVNWKITETSFNKKCFYTKYISFDHLRLISVRTLTKDVPEERITFDNKFIRKKLANIQPEIANIKQHKTNPKFPYITGTITSVLVVYIIQFVSSSSSSNNGGGERLSAEGFDFF